MPIAHVSLPVSSLPSSKAFYEAALKPLNYAVYMSLDAAVGFAPRYGGPDFWIHQCPEEEDGGNVKQAQKTHVALVGKSHAQVKEFYEAAL
jgi:catechol 2,3-dioxygenase-like lactoylglutathione lyase family enzyme